MSTFSPGMTAALARFLAEPGRATIEALLLNSKDFIFVQARSWRHQGLAFVDRCREIMSELFLILTEHVVGERAAGPESLLAYLALRLRRLTRPRAGKAVPLGLATDLPEVGRCGFTPFRLDLVREIVKAVRTALVTEARTETRELEFLFLHLMPEMAWGSRLLARAAGQDPQTRLEADKKRHQAFNRDLRARFEAIACGDWRDILNWSAGERSHLAWSIIDLTPDETRPLSEDDLEALETWRTDPTAAAGDPARVRTTLARFLTALAGVHRPRPVKVAEPRATYGTPADEDLLELLFSLAPVEVGMRVASPAPMPLARSKVSRKRPDAVIPPTPAGMAADPDHAIDPEDEEDAFRLALSEVLEWSQVLLGKADAGKPLAAAPGRQYPQG